MCLQAFSQSPNRWTRCRRPVQTLAMTVELIGSQTEVSAPSIKGDAKVEQLRRLMAAADGGKGVQAYIIPSEDPHMVRIRGALHHTTCCSACRPCFSSAALAAMRCVQQSKCVFATAMSPFPPALWQLHLPPACIAVAVQ